MLMLSKDCGTQRKREGGSERDQRVWPLFERKEGSQAGEIQHDRREEEGGEKEEEGGEKVKKERKSRMRSGGVLKGAAEPQKV